MLEQHRICKNISEFAEARVVTFLNPYSLLKIYESEVSLERFDKVGIDGIALKIFLSLACRYSEIERLSFDFTSVANFVFDRAVARSERGFILGSDPRSNKEFLARVGEMFPGIDIEGRTGYFDDDRQFSDFIGTLASSGYDYVVIGMGAVKQEEAANALVEYGFDGRIYTCGGFIHQTASSGGKYYPMWVDKYNLRFAYRMISEPSTIGRYVIDYPRAFILLFRNIKKFRH